MTVTGKKVLHIAECGGGVERYLSLLLPGLNDEEFRQYLICSKKFDFDFFESHTEATEIVDMTQTFNPIKIIKSILSIRKFIKQINPDLIYCHSSFGGFLGRLSSLGMKKRIIYNPHGWAFNMNCSKMRYKLYIFIERMLAKMTDGIVCISENEKTSALSKSICDIEKLHIIYNGVDVTKIAEQTNDANNCQHEKFVVGMVGRISVQKAPDVFVSMAEKLKRLIPNVHFCIVGDGVDREIIENRIKEKGLWNDFSITGWVDNVDEYIAKFDVGVLLSRWEGFGLALCEYMVAGVPVVATNVDAIPEVIINGENGLLVNKDDDDAACEAVMKIYQDKEYRDRLVANAKVFVKQKFDVQRTIRESRQLFRCFFED